jgi:hypothetical protein
MKTTAKKICAVGVALCSMTAQSWASCARPEEATALKAAAVQQELMVAALTCSQIALYNHFVISYRTELQQSDSALQSFFLRQNAHTGMADYHAYKTRLANQASLSSLHNGNYCQDTQEAFDDALDGGKTTLAAFVASQPDPDNSYASCSDDSGRTQSVRGQSYRLPPSTRTADRRD